MDVSTQAGDGSLREELRSDAETLTGSAKQKLHSELDARRGPAASQVKSVSSALDAAADELSGSPTWLRSAFEEGARALQRFADTMEHKDSRELARDVQQMARAHPGMFLAACAAAGFAGARVLKAGAEPSNGAPAAQSYGQPYGQPAMSQATSAFTGLEATDGPTRTSPQPIYQGGI